MVARTFVSRSPVKLWFLETLTVEVLYSYIVPFFSPYLPLFLSPSLPLGRTAVHWAAMVNNVEALKLLIRQGPDTIKDTQDSKVCLRTWQPSGKTNRLDASK